MRQTVGLSVFVELWQYTVLLLKRGLINNIMGPHWVTSSDFILQRRSITEKSQISPDQSWLWLSLAQGSW